MRQLMDYLKKINGFDSLSFGLLFLSLCLFILPVVIPVEGLRQYHLAGFFPLAVCLIRIFLPGAEGGSQANERYEAMVGPLFDGIASRKEVRRQKKIFRFFQCPVCNQTLRVPKGKGRVEITCPNCDHKFIRNA